MMRFGVCLVALLITMTSFQNAFAQQIAAPLAEDAPARPLVLWYRQPAKSVMNEALPIGNGQLGALVMGGVQNERVAFNEDSLWTGNDNPSGDYETESFGAYQAFGDLLIALPSSSQGQPLVTSPSGQKAFFDTEAVTSSVDGNPGTKWTVEHGGRPVIWEMALPTPHGVASYSFTSANDVPERDPQNWCLEGSLDGTTWVVLDDRQNQPPFEQRGQTRSYTFANTTAYRYYRFTFAPNLAVPHFQIAEISLGGVASNTGTEATNYRRELDLSSAIARTSFTLDGVHHVRETFVSHPAQVLALRWSADKAGAVSGLIALKGAHDEVTSAQGNALTFSGILNNGLRYEARAQVITRGGSVTATAAGVQLKNCDEAVVLLAAGTDYAMNFATRYRGVMPPLQQRLDEAAKQGYTSLERAHLRDYRSLFDRVSLDVGASSAAQKAMPTDERRLMAFKTTDPELEETLFQYGRYLLISSSRPGGLPANLQGLWNDSNTPAWHSDYHANINIQMNYWPAEVTNLAPMHEPFFDLIESQLPAWRKATQSSPDWKTPSGRMSPRGWAIRTSHNITGGLGWQWDKTANAWYCQHLWEHYAFALDKDYLRRVAYPIIKETVEFWEDHLKTLPDGRLVVPDGWSPEHGPHEDGVSYNQQIVWDLFSNYIEAANALGVDKEYAARVTAMRDKLVGPQIGKWGQLQEWMTDRDDPNDHHRHTSHLFAVYPGRQIGVTTNPALAKAAKVSLDARGTDPSSDVREWSFAWRTALYARLHDGEGAHAMVQQLFSSRNTCSNLFGLHPPMQIDGNFGVTAAIAEMLLQSHEGEIELLPALPKEWSNGLVKGLRARGGFEVDIRWGDGRLTSATIRSATATTAKIRHGQTRISRKVKAGQSVTLEARDFGTPR